MYRIRSTRRQTHRVRRDREEATETGSQREAWKHGRLGTHRKAPPERFLPKH